jgi:putative glutamine amidotransferase
LQDKKPIIGITGSWMIDANAQFKEYKKAYVNDDYIVSVIKAGGIPYIIPANNDEEIIRAQVANVDALVFSGGTDVNPVDYGQEFLPKMTKPDVNRDKFDLSLASYAKEMKKPTLGICRGHQILAVANGGTLYQDLSYKSDVSLRHDQVTIPELATHKVQISKDSLLYEILQKDEVWTNSFHHQIVKDIPQNCTIVGVSSDGVIEAIEYKSSDYFYLTVQWHPEMMASKDNEDMIKLFKRLVKEAKK